MSIIEWYLYKAEQCTQMAKEAADPSARAKYNELQKIWRKFAKQEAASDNSTLH